MRYGPNDPLSPTLGGWDSLANLRAVGELSDSANAAEARQRAQGEADERTREAREAMKKLARDFGEQDALALLCTLQMLVAASPWKHTECAGSVSDGIADATAALEDSIEVHG
jgi:hypothetical protein